MSLGRLDGIGVGPPVGSWLGTNDGISLGLADGLTVGPPVGS